MRVRWETYYYYEMVERSSFQRNSYAIYNHSQIQVQKTARWHIFERLQYENLECESQILVFTVVP